MRSSRRGGLVVAGLAALTLGTISTVWAYWPGSGNGSGSAAAGADQPVTLGPATATAELYPGGQSPVVLSIANPNAGSVRVGSLALEPTLGTGGFVVDAGHPACGVTSLGFTTQTNGGSGWTVPGNGSLPVTLAGSLTMNTSAANACQGATFTIYLRAGL